MNGSQISLTNVVFEETKVEKIDPVKTKNELFVGWGKPKLLLVFTGFLDGYIEPCGCAGLEQMKGGLSRRHTMFKELTKNNWEYVAIDAGNINKGFGLQEELKYNFVVDESMRLMKYRAIGIGNRELLFPTEVLLLYTVDVLNSPKYYTSANIAVLAFNPEVVKPYRIIKQAGLKIGVTSVLAASFGKTITNGEIIYVEAVEKLREILPKLNDEKCDKKILIIHGSNEEVIKITKIFQNDFDYIVGSNTPAEPPIRPNFVGKSMLIEVGEKGKFAVAVGLYDDQKTPFRYQSIPLDSRYKNSDDVLIRIKLYQTQLEKTGLSGLGIKPIDDSRTGICGKYSGTKQCIDCHEEAHKIWRKSKHANAWNALAKEANPPRIYDPECIACHVVGWNRKEQVPYKSGFSEQKTTPDLINVGCESCHGPCENHVKAEQGADIKLQENLRKAIKLSVNNNAKKICIECHDGDNSPHFEFNTYWKKIKHKENE
ncbi:MAG: hypothetical protein LBC74_06365 [Planctomycetaceae bacterium]|nr:hypothetical protein [Planctomycetaceae bacterium]